MSKNWWLTAAILTFITIISWVIFDVIHARSKVEISGDVQEVIEPISPDLDTQSLKGEQ